MQLIPSFEWDVCAVAADVADDKGMRFTPDRVAEPLSKYGAEARTRVAKEMDYPYRWQGGAKNAI